MAVKHWNEMTPAEREAEDARIETAEDAIATKTDEELRALVDPVRDLPPGEWSEEHLRADSELHRRERAELGGFIPETPAQIEAHGGTVHISIRMPSALLQRLQAEADRRGTRYQTLMKELIEAGLASESPTSAPVTVRLSRAQVRDITRRGRLVIEVAPAPEPRRAARRRASGPRTKLRS
jgi:hypothetical protein